MQHVVQCFILTMFRVSTFSIVQILEDKIWRLADTRILIFSWF